MVFFHTSVMVAWLLITDGLKASTSLNVLIESPGQRVSQIVQQGDLNKKSALERRS